MLSLSLNVNGIPVLSGTPYDREGLLASVRQGQMIAGEQTLQKRFRARGGRRFWQSAADSVEARATASHVEINVYQVGVRLRWLGGHVTSPTGKLMAIPQDAGNARWPAHYGGVLKFVSVKGSPRLKGLLVEAERRPHKRPGKKGPRMIIAPLPNGRIVYSLIDSADHKPDPSVIDLDELQEAVSEQTQISIDNYLNKISKKS